MIDASFDKLSRRTAIDGAYQYDTGQRLRLSGLPSPEEMSGEDEFLSGDLAAVQVHFGYIGDPQTQMRLAEWDEDRWVWLADIPDEFLTRSEQVNVYVYVSHGTDESGSRNKTMYEGVFTPISRPAPNNVATEDQIEAWNELKQEIELALTAVNTATDNAQSIVKSTESAAQTTARAATAAENAADSAEDAVDRLHAQETRFRNLTVRTTTLAAGANATATLSGNVLTYGIPRGATGAQGDPGAAGPADISLSYSNGVLTITPK